MNYRAVIISTLLYLIIAGIIGTQKIFAADSSVSQNISYLSEAYSDKTQCGNDVKKYSQKYPDFSHSDCFEGENKQYFYNICEGETCGIINKETSLQVDELIEKIGKSLEGRSDTDIKIWYKIFQSQLDKLIENYDNNPKNKVLLITLDERINQAVDSNTLIKQTQYTTKKENEQITESSGKQNDITEPIQGLYRVTSKTYKGDFMNQGDICKVEYGNDWKSAISKNMDASIMAINRMKEGSKLWNLHENISTSCDKFSNTSGQGYYTYTKSNRFITNQKLSCNQEAYIVCERDPAKETNHTQVIQGLYKATENVYSVTQYRDYKNFDFCKEEYGRGWKTSYTAADAHIMLQSKAGVTTWSPAAKSGSQKYIACMTDSKNLLNENYKEILTTATPKEIDIFMDTVAKNMKSKIKETDKYVYFNDTYAVTKDTYYGNQIYSENVCPVGYDLSKNNSLYYNNYEKQLIGYYLENNMSKFKISYPDSVSKSYPTLEIKLWRGSTQNENYVNKVSLERLKENALSTYFSAAVFRFNNPAQATKNSSYSTFHFSSYIGGSNTMGIKNSALCVNQSKKVNTNSSGIINTENLFGIKNISENMQMNNSNANSSRGIFYSYGKALATGFFDKHYGNSIGNQYFIPYKSGSYTVFKMKKLYNENK